MQNAQRIIRGSCQEKLGGWGPQKEQQIRVSNLNHPEPAPTSNSEHGDTAKGMRTPRKSDFEGQGDFIIGLPQNWGKQRFHSQRAQTNLSCTKTQGERAVTPQDTEPELYASVGGSPLQSCVSKTSLWE